MINSYNPSISFKGVMLTTDLDGTLLIPANEHMKIDVEDRLYREDSIKKAEAAIKRNNIDSVLLNTGRNFTELGEVQDILETSEMPITAISLEDGKRLLVKPENMTSKEWIQLLFNKNINYLAFKDDNWTKLNNSPIRDIGEYLTKKKGFIHRNDNGERMIYSKPVEKDDTGVKKSSKDALWIVTLVPPGIDFEVNVRNMSDSDDIDIASFNKEISSEIEEMLKQKGYDIENLKTKRKETYVNSIERKDVNKGSVSDYVKSKDENGNITGEIRAGNADNDISMLRTTEPNVQSIQVGDDSVLKQLLTSYKNVTYVPVGELGSGIDQAYKKLDLSV